MMMKVRDVLKRLVAFHSSNADIPIGTLKQILKTAGLE
jgi:predicted RNA binding protein YcfA (HicA-like mRNA interferase family)